MGKQPKIIIRGETIYSPQFYTSHIKKKKFDRGDPKMVKIE